MNAKLLGTKSIKEIVDGKYKFFIPDYQRGYRWEKEEVTDLLNDIEEFAKNSKGFYCLQPLVVLERKPENPGSKTVWEVVDGQQRLTTLFLILCEIGPKEATFNIQYERHIETINGLGELLEKLNSDNENGVCLPDFYYIKNASKAINEWFGKNKGHHLSKLGQVDGPDIRFIWYQIAVDDSIPAFMRLNTGKIPLTPAELVRALFLHSGKLEKAKRLQLALSWDQIERRLQESDFWAFLTIKDYKPENRIELLLAHSIVGKNENDKRFIFNYFFGELKNQKNNDDKRNKLWASLEDLFSTFKEWYETSYLFHLVGFLIESGVSLEALAKEATKKGGCKNDFRDHLMKQTREEVLPKVVDFSFDSICDYLKTLSYDQHAKQIRSVLLCLNLVTLVPVNDKTKTGTIRFSFSAYKNEANGWDIEHIRATESRLPKGKKELKEALKAIKEYAEIIRKDSIFEMLEEYEEKKPQELLRLYQKSIDELEDKEIEASNDISNLTLLDVATNRGYGNSPFQVKRRWILGPDHQAKYVLPCTRNVFSKGYSSNPATLLQWTKADADDYLKAMSETLSQFFSNGVKVAE